MVEKEVLFKVFRYKQGDEAPHYDMYTIRVDDDTTVLVALQTIRRDLDPSLALRHSCHHGSCGTCAMRINGKERLACVVHVMELGTSRVVVEPMRNIPLISDLVVDMSHFYTRMNEVDRPYVRQSEYLPTAEIPEGMEQFMRYENCIECGACVSACPIAASDHDYYGPAALAAAWRVFEEPRGKDPQAALDWADNENGCWRCHMVFECTEVCPSNVDPGGKIMAIRRELTKQKFRSLFKFGRGG